MVCDLCFVSPDFSLFLLLFGFCHASDMDMMVTMKLLWSTAVHLATISLRIKQVTWLLVRGTTIV